MGSTGVEHDKGIDFKVGGLVWVRRRNGSWWPGKILSPDELPDGGAAVPKSGTPVKLLGKKGKTVDWYNLEKSKRVKAFHCGEYEDCIEKAKVSASHLSKKGVRKARREDAIRHALELESALLLKENPGASTTPNLANGRGPAQIYASASVSHPSGVFENHDMRNSEHSEVNHRATKTDSPFEEQEKHKDEAAKWKTPNDSEEDVVGVKRMRGLEDLGVGVASSLKRKRSQVAYESLKKRNRHRPLTKVLECSTMLSSPLEQFPCKNGLSDGMVLERMVSGFEANESINSISIEVKTEGECMGFLCGNGTARGVSMQVYEWKDDENESSANLFDVPLVSEGMPTAVVSDASQRAEFGGTIHQNQSSLVETISFGSGEKIEPGSTKSGSNYPHEINLNTEKATSDWQTKGRRNSRSRKMDAEDENLCGLKGKESKVENPRGSESEIVASQKLLPHCMSNVNPKYDSGDFSLRRHFSDSCLCDIVVEVKSGSQQQHAPYVSLMSKVNNLPITGQPLEIEVLEDGSCSDMFIHSILDEQEGIGLPFKPHASESPISRAKSRKSKKSGMLSKKTRRLSSITSTRGYSQEARKPVIRTFKSSVACIPLTVVFSRISAALSNQTYPKARFS